MFRKLIAGTAFVAMAASAQRVLAGQGRTTSAKVLERGRYLVKIAGCNDCHTPGYLLTGGKVPEAQWLTGDELIARGLPGAPMSVSIWFREYQARAFQVRKVRTNHESCRLS